MISRHLIEGGISFMLPIYILWICVIIISVLNFVQLKGGKKSFESLTKRNNLVMFLGSFTFLLGILGQTMGLMAAFDAIHAAGDVAPALIFGGLRVAMLAPTYGFVLLIISFVIWFINKNYLIK